MLPGVQWTTDSAHAKGARRGVSRALKIMIIISVMKSALTPCFPAPVRLGLLAGTLGVAALSPAAATPGAAIRRAVRRCVAPGSGSPGGGDRDRGPGGAGPEARLVYTHAGGIGVLDAATLKPIGGAELKWYNRLSPAGTGATFSWPPAMHSASSIRVRGPSATAITDIPTQPSPS